MMKMVPDSSGPVDVRFVVERVAGIIGIPLEFRKGAGASSTDWEVRVSAFAKPYGFYLNVTEDFMAWWVEIELDSLGRATLDSMFRRWKIERESFESYLSIGREKNETFELLIDGMEPELLDTGDEWTSLSFESSMSYSDSEYRETVLVDLLADVLSVLLALLIDNTEWAEPNEFKEFEAEALGKVEGRVMDIRVRKYERSRFNRRYCLDAFGFSCRGCGMSLGEKYGPIGKDVIHVHHIVPVSRMGSAYRINPRRDLVPLCPNCHNIVHRQDPPVSISELNLLTAYIPPDISRNLSGP